MNDEASGLIFNIQRFSVHDGPGIRTTVFMKGCPLRCLWCSNPESQGFSPDLLARDVLCSGCGACVAACLNKAITLSRDKGRIIDRSRCNLCMLCVPACLYGSLIVCGKGMTLAEVLEEVLKDRIFYKNSGGGVTISGGEALSQGRFVRNLLVQCKNEGLYTALDTSGYGSWKALEALLPWVDLLLFDLKHLDAGEHERTTGVRHDVILSNLKRAAQKTPVWLRIPLIAGLNDSEDHIKKIAFFGKDLGVQRISFLPYHEGGRSKNKQLGRPDLLPDAKAPDDDRLQLLKGIVEGLGVNAVVGH